MDTANTAALANVDLGDSVYPSCGRVHSSCTMQTRCHCNLRANGWIWESRWFLTLLRVKAVPEILFFLSWYCNLNLTIFWAFCLHQINCVSRWRVCRDSSISAIWNQLEYWKVPSGVPWFDMIRDEGTAGGESHRAERGDKGKSQKLFFFFSDLSLRSNQYAVWEVF